MGGFVTTSVAAGTIATGAPVTDIAGSYEVITLPPEVVSFRTNIPAAVNFVRTLSRSCD